MWVLFLLLMVLSGIGAVVFLILTIMKKRRAWIGLVATIGVGAFSTVGLFIALIFAVPTDSEPAVATIDDENIEESEATEDNPKEESEEITELDVEVDETYEVNGLNIHISNIEITEKDVKVHMTINNEGDNSKSFHPDQHDLIIGNKQYGANMFMTKGDVSGEIHSGVEKTGTIRFMADDDGFNVAEIEEITLKLGNVFDEDSFETEAFDETISIN
ncbi:hypothetical protein [Pseudogracilibacillus sp. SO30301A]|uniref:hypothetical protein n=1 Tax=Pseudogracilibacillus sp. SO30301A TaxID=3098291 RepID=UPI00300E0D5B